MKYFVILFLVCNSVYCQQTQIDFKTAQANLKVNAETREVTGSVVYTLNVLKAVDTIKIDAQNMVFTNVKFGRKTVKTNNTGKQLQLIRKFKKGKHKISFDYVAKPKQTMYFIGSGENAQIWTQGQGKYTSHWFPSFDDVNEKVVFNI
ncbi:MAG TPA: M1 family peptidase, partial [Flavobacterium sp.]